MFQVLDLMVPLFPSLLGYRYGPFMGLEALFNLYLQQVIALKTLQLRYLFGEVVIVLVFKE